MQSSERCRGQAKSADRNGEQLKSRDRSRVQAKSADRCRGQIVLDKDLFGHNHHSNSTRTAVALRILFVDCCGVLPIQYHNVPVLSVGFHTVVAVIVFVVQILVSAVAVAVAYVAEEGVFQPTAGVV